MVQAIGSWHAGRALPYRGRFLGKHLRSFLVLGFRMPKRPLLSWWKKEEGVMRSKAHRNIEVPPAPPAAQQAASQERIAPGSQFSVLSSWFYDA